MIVDKVLKQSDYMKINLSKVFYMFQGLNLRNN